MSKMSTKKSPLTSSSVSSVVMRLKNDPDRNNNQEISFSSFKTEEVSSSNSSSSSSIDNNAIIHVKKEEKEVDNATVENQHAENNGNGDGDEGISSKNPGIVRRVYQQPVKKDQKQEEEREQDTQHNASSFEKNTNTNTNINMNDFSDWKKGNWCWLSSLLATTNNNTEDNVDEDITTDSQQQQQQQQQQRAIQMNSEQPPKKKLKTNHNDIRKQKCAIDTATSGIMKQEQASDDNDTGDTDNRNHHCEKGVEQIDSLKDEEEEDNSEYKESDTNNNDKKKEISVERINYLESIGFVWKFIDRVPWIEMYERLVNYKQCYGSTLVPHNYTEDLRLSNWVNKQRFNYNHGKLSEKRMELLNSIDFVWLVEKRNNIS